MTGDPLRSKDLIPVVLPEDPEWKEHKGDGRGQFLCAVSRNSITNQPVVLLKSTCPRLSCP